jgi:DNA modification methylase
VDDRTPAVVVRMILQGDVVEQLKTLSVPSIQCVVTSPPYWGLRNYGVPGQIGSEKTPDEYVHTLVSVFREVRRVMHSDGTLWLNLGDSFKMKNLVGIPWRVAFALQADGWYLRADIIWHKPRCMPSSVQDRPTRNHEYLFLLTKSSKYYYDADAIREPLSNYYAKVFAVNGGQRVARPTGVDNFNKQRRFETGLRDATTREARAGFVNPKGRNKRSVWTISPQTYRGAHFAVFPEQLVEPCVLAGSQRHQTVLDPFCGSGTTGVVATRLHRDFIGIELNPTYVRLAEERIAASQGVFREVA